MNLHSQECLTRSEHEMIVEKTRKQREIIEKRQKIDMVVHHHILHVNDSQMVDEMFEPISEQTDKVASEFKILLLYT